MLATHGPADLLLGNNVLAHVPNLNDFVGGMKILLAENGVITMEFPHLMRLVEENQFDTIYHEHYSYLSFTTVERIFAQHGLVLFDVEEHQAMLSEDALHRGEAQVGVVLVVDRVELGFFDEAQQMGELESGDAGWGQHLLDTRHEVVEVRSVR